MSELYKTYRPKALSEILGQSGAVASLERLIKSNKIPHAILLTGPSGVGKTTIARILKQHLRCSDVDFFESNCADARGVEDIREIRRRINYRPMSGLSRIWLIDECHKMTNDAQNALLKMLEDTPSHVYFMLGTTNPEKLIKAIHTRCSQIKLTAMKPLEIVAVLTRVIKKEKMEVSEDVIDAIVEAAEGSARKALVILEQAGYLDDDEAQLRAVMATSLAKDAAIDLARLLINPRPSWAEVAKVLSQLSDEEPESIRYAVLGYMRSIMLKGGKIAPRAYAVVDVFSRNFFDSKHAGLAAACWEVTN